MLNDKKARARTSDPWTSHAAADSMSAYRLNAQQKAILQVLQSNQPPLAAEQIDDRLGYPAFRRMSELKRAGLIVDSGEVHTGRSGRGAIKYKITAAGRDFAEELDQMEMDI
jgi:predicted ArsR family transcriptional regulator